MNLSELSGCQEGIDRMLQDTGELHIAYRHDAPSAEVRCVLIRGREVLLKEEAAGSALPLYGELGGNYPLRDQFDLGGKRCGLIHLDADTEIACCTPMAVSACRNMVSLEDLYIIYTAWHLETWYEANRFCGRCGTPTVADDKERMRRCPKCGQMIFPKICPAMVVAILHEDKLLLTRYANRPFKNYALVAGFVEIGETAEQTVAREAMEEVGLKLKNIRYLGSQPWGVVGNLMMGFSAEVDGSPEVRLDDGELCEARWFRREEIPQRDDISLTGDIIQRFQRGEI